MEDKKIKHLLLAIQKDDFKKFEYELKLLESYFNNTQLLEASSSFINQIVRQNSGDSALHFAARHGSIEILKYLIEEKHADIEIKNHDRKTPLHDAAQFSHEECVEYLLEKGADVNAIKKADWTPLMLACTKENIPIITSLLSHGGNPFLRNKDGWTSFHLAAREGNLAIVKLLVNFIQKSNADSEAALKELCDSRSRNGRKPIHTAALHGHLDVVKYLLDSHLSGVDETDNCGSTPLHDGCRSGSNDLVDLLLELGADINAENKEGYNALHVATEAGMCNVIVNLVVNHKMSINSTTKHGNLTALKIAVKEKQTRAVDTLKKLDLDTSSR